jgi:hypothetical protein
MENRRKARSHDNTGNLLSLRLSFTSLGLAVRTTFIQNILKDRLEHLWVIVSCAFRPGAFDRSITRRKGPRGLWIHLTVSHVLRTGIRLN